MKSKKCHLFSVGSRAHSYKSIIDMHIIPNSESLKIQNVNGMQLQHLNKKLSEEGLSPKTIENIFSVLHKALETAMKEGSIAKNPCDIVELSAQVKPDIKPLSDKEIANYLKAIQNHGMGSAYILCLIGGLREGECLGLSWEQVNFETHTLLIN